MVRSQDLKGTLNVAASDNEPRSTYPLDLHPVAHETVPAAESYGSTSPMLFNPFLPIPHTTDLSIAADYDNRIRLLFDVVSSNPTIAALPFVQNAYRAAETLERWRQGMRELAENGQWYRLGEIALNPKKWTMMPQVSSSHQLVS